jgi:hypothetical protein
MNHLPLRKEDLKKYQNDVDIVHKTALQIIKDFAQFGLDISFPTNLNAAYIDLFEQLAPTIRDLLDSNQAKLFSLLYCIDLDEKYIKKSLEEMDEVPLHEVIAHLLLERELKKVITRNFLSNHNSTL